MKKFVFDKYYVPRRSPWPFFVALSANNLCVSLILWVHYEPSLYLVVLGFMGVAFSSIRWWRDLLVEVDAGLHTRYVVKRYRDGVGFFIFSEVIFFASIFWGFFHSRLRVSTNLDLLWPPRGIRTPKPFATAGFNTFLLISRGAYVTYSHSALRLGSWWFFFASQFDNKEQPFAPADIDAIKGLRMAVICGVLFLGLQIREYYWNSFTISDRVYGRSFYMLTGFHGCHVLAGTVWLIVCLGRIYLGHFTKKNHFGYTAAIWYWHIVDVVWIVVWVCVYIWGGGHMYIEVDSESGVKSRQIGKMFASYVTGV